MEAVAGGIRRELTSQDPKPASPGKGGEVPLLDAVVSDMSGGRKSTSPKIESRKVGGKGGGDVDEKHLDYEEDDHVVLSDTMLEEVRACEPDDLWVGTSCACTYHIVLNITTPLPTPMSLLLPSQDVELERAGNMFQGIGDAVVASEWEGKWHVGWKIKGRLLLKTSWFNVLVALTTIYAIVGMEVSSNEESCKFSRDSLVPNTVNTYIVDR